MPSCRQYRYAELHDAGWRVPDVSLRSICLETKTTGVTLGNPSPLVLTIPRKRDACEAGSSDAGDRDCGSAGRTVPDPHGGRRRPSERQSCERHESGHSIAPSARSARWKCSTPPPRFPSHQQRCWSRKTRLKKLRHPDGSATRKQTRSKTTFVSFSTEPQEREPLTAIAHIRSSRSLTSPLKNACHEK